MKFRGGGLRFRRPTGWLDGLAITMLGSLLLIHLVHTAFAFMARSNVIVQATFALDRRFDVVWAGEYARKEIVSTLRDAMPKFRQRQPILDIEERSMTVTAIVRSDVPANPLFEDVTRRLTAMAREKYTVGAYDNPISFSGLQITPYAWFRSLDFVAAVVLLGSILAWVLTDGRPNGRASSIKGRAAAPATFDLTQ